MLPSWVTSKDHHQVISPLVLVVRLFSHAQKRLTSHPPSHLDTVDKIE